MARVFACGPTCPFDATVRTVFLDSGASLYGWPSQGGCIVLEQAYSCDFEWLGLDPLNPPLERDDDATAEDEFCERLLMLGAHWWDSEARLSIVRSIEDEGTGRVLHPRPRVHGAFVLDEQPEPTMREKRLIRVGWPSTGGLWVAEFDTTWSIVHEEDNLLDEDIGRLALVRTMNEKCALLRDRFQAKFYAKVEDYSGYGFLKAWSEDHTGEVGPLLQPEQTKQLWGEGFYARR